MSAQPSPTEDSKSDLENVKDAVQIMLTLPPTAKEDSKKEFQEGLAKILENLTDASKVRSAFESVLQPSSKDNIDPILQKQVQFLHDIHHITGKDAKFFVYICRQKPSGFTEIAKKCYHTPEVSSTVSQDKIHFFRSWLFQNHPTAVLVSLVERGRIKISDAVVKAAVVDILSAALDEGFDISQDSTRVLLKQTTFPKSVITKAKKILVGEAIKKIQRLQALVRDPDHVGILAAADYDTAASIANTDLAAFQTEMAKKKMAKDDAERIHDHASTIQIRNEQTWALVLSQRNDELLPRVLVNKVNVKPGLDSEDQRPGAKKRINLTTLFQDMDTVACTECSSVLSPSAYFVDLLRLLQETKTTTVDSKVQPSTLFTKLMERRPDLQHLQLSCANTNTMVPYLDLVTEILESFIVNLSSTGSVLGPSVVQVFDAPSIDAGGACTSQPRNTNYDLYDRVVAKQVFPMHAFPYKLSLHTIREFLQAAGTSRWEVATTFSSVDRVMSILKPLGEKRWNSGDRDRLQTTVRTMVDLHNAAEYLQLNQEDIMAICGESFQSLAFWQARNKEADTVISPEAYQSDMGICSAAELWGYSAVGSYTAEKNMLDETNGTGLTFIKLQLLDRAGITMQELQEILETQFMARRLIITTVQLSSDGKKSVFTGKLSDMRLRLSLLGSVTSSLLTEDVCHDLQAFIRLWRKLPGWSINDLDTVLSTLKRRAQGPINGISTMMIHELAAVKRLSDMSKIPPGELQVLWGDIDTNGPQTLYAKVFLSPRVVQLDPYFKPDSKGNFLGSKENITQHRATLLNTLGILEADLPAILSASLVVGDDGVEKSLNGESELNIQNLSLLYRTSLICRILDLKPDQYLNFSRLFPKLDTLENPKTTLDIFERYTSLCRASWSIEDILVATQMEIGPNIEHVALSAASSIASAKLGIELKDKTAQDDDVGADAEMKRMMPLLFDASSSLNVTKLFEGNLKTTIEVTFKQQATEEIKTPAELLPKLSCINLDQGKRARVTLTGILSSAELELALNLIKGDENWTTAIQSLYQNSRSVFDLVCRQIQIDSQAIQEAEKLFSSTDDSAPKARKTFVVTKALPKVNAQLLRQTIIDSVAVSFPIAAAPLAALVGDIIRYARDDSLESVSAYEALRSIKLHDANEKTFEGYFCPPASGKFQFIVDNGTDQTPQMSVNGIKLIFTSSLGVWKSEQMEYRLISGKYFPFTFTGNIEKQIKYTTQDSLTPSDLRPDMFVSRKSRNVALAVYQKLAAASKVVLAEKLSLPEVEYLQASNMIDFNNVTFHGMERVNAYRQVRDDTVREESEYSLVQFLSWASSKDPPSKDLISKVSLATGWQAKQLESVLNYKFPWMGMEEKLKLFQDEKELVRINRILKLISTIKLPAVTVLGLFRIATPSDPKAVIEKIDERNSKLGNSTIIETVEDMEEIAASLRLAAQSSTLDANVSSALVEANDKLRETQRTVLIHYLLNHDKIKFDLDIHDADGLFEHFLVDVKMGAKLQTSRMRQAISTVQLFVQRCSLGLESVTIPENKTKDPPVPATEVKCSSVSSVRWKYMSKFNLWVAHRKLFLYPENWIDPTLRDNRTEPFKALEGALSQTTLNAETISAAIKAYIYQVNEISDLEVLSYTRQQIDTAASTFHFFAKTRQVPFQYYYRYASVKSAKKSDIRWAPWTKIDVEIPTIESDIHGNPLPMSGAHVIPAINRGRLFLFIPQFMAQSRPPKPSQDTFTDMAGKSPGSVTNKKVWEMKLGWTEYRNGKWTSKQVSQSSLRFPEIEAPQYPPLSSLRFFVSGSSSKGSALVLDHDTLYIDVQSWYQMTDLSTAYEVSEKPVTADTTSSEYKGTRQWPLGRFRIKGSQIDAIPPKMGANEWKGPSSDTNDPDQKAMALTPNDHSLPTTFSKLWAKSIPVETKDEKGNITLKQYAQQKSQPSIQQGSSREFVLLARRGVDSSIEQEYTWTVSFDQTRYKAPSALVLQVSDRLKSETFFAMPPASADEKTSSTVHLFNHPNMGDIMERSTMYDDVQGVYKYLNGLTDTEIQDSIYGKIEDEYNEQSTPYALYTWELGMHAISLLMERCAATQQHELALEVARLVFDPSADANEDKSVTRCWQFLPFKKICATQSITDILQSLAPETPGVPSAVGMKVEEWKNNSFNPHSVARGRPNVYMKRFVLKYIEILIAAGDELFRQNSLESVPLAIQRYVEASHLYGPIGKMTPKMGKLPVKTFDQLSTYIDAFSNAVVEMELDFPYSCEPCYRGAVNPATKLNPDATKPAKYAGLVQTGYFCLPPNIKLMEIRNLIDDRLFKIRNCLDINGNAISLALFDPPLDPAVISRAEAANLSPSVLLNDMDTPMPNYRFYYLLQKANEICSELRSLGEQFMAAKEKRDSESLTILLARNEVVSSTTQLSIKDLQRTESIKSIASLEEARKSSVMRLSFYLGLIGESQDKVPDQNTKWIDIQQSIEKPTNDDLRMTSYEKREMDKSDSSAELSEKAAVLELSAGALMAIPNLLSNMQPMGVGVAIKMDAENVAKLLQCTASALNLKSQMDAHDAQRASRKGAMIRQLQERRLQANMAGWEIKKIDKDLEVQRVHLAQAESEIRAQQQQIDHAREVQEWHSTKYTNTALYSWLENSFRTLYHKTFLLAMQLARKAERSFQFEMGGRLGTSNNISFLAPGGYWDSARDGLLSANNLYLGLKRLEAAYIEKRPHDYEISKNISLRQVDPVALFSLRQKGSASFSLNEILFDMDFPGHYFRRIKSIAISIPAIVGPYSGLNCTLSLTEHRIRVAPSTTSESYAYKGRDDVRFQTDTIPISSIAVSSGTNDSGTFELNFSGERYLPFEGAGCYSRWKLEFPAEYKQFDYNTIADVIIHIRYTSIEGGLPMRDSANKSVKEYLGALQTDDTAFVGPTSLIDLKNDFTNEWYNLVDGPTEATKVKLTQLADRLPFFARGRTCKIKGAVAYICTKPNASDVGVELLKPTHTFEPAAKPDMNIEGLVIVSNNHMNIDFNTDWELGVTKKDDIENILLLLQFQVEDNQGSYKDS